jgi:hypothetical protein
MNWAWAASLDQFWRSPTFPLWLILATAGLFGLVALIALLRAEKSVANGALTVITLLAIGTAVAVSIREFAPSERSASGEIRSAATLSAALPALSCIDDLAGEMVLAACEKALFGSAESAAAAVSYAASQLTRLTASGGVAADKTAPPELQTLRRAVERDRYGLMAYVLVARDRCTASACAAFQALTDRHQIVANMDEKTYEGLITRHAPSWNAPAAQAAAGPVTAWAPSMPTGKPTTAEFPSAASTPAVNIMTPEPGQAAAPATPRSPPAALANAPLPSPRPATTTTAPANPAAPAAPTLAAAKKQPAPPKPPRTAGPVQLAPAAANSSTASAPAASE